jgi:7-keto-8-aminopelargonate synthetase-like enzyme
MAELCKKYNALLMIDEAHATGVLGKTGHGSLEHFHLKPTTDVDVVLGTCSKALASSGGFVVGSHDLVKYLRVGSRSYMFSTAMLPAASAALIAVLEVIRDEPERRAKLWENANYARNELRAAGFDTLTSETQIIPILIGEDAQAIAMSRKLFERGIFAPAVRWPAVAKRQARLRLTVMATHTKEQIDYLVENVTALRRILQF